MGQGERCKAAMTPAALLLFGVLVLCSSLVEGELDGVTLTGFALS